jgi:hypothetical protein
MTIIEPNKSKFKSNFLIILIIGLIISGAVLSIFAYNKSVSLSYNLNIQRKSVEALQVENADLKNQLYAVLDFQNAAQLADRLGLIKEKKPEYLARYE